MLCSIVEDLFFPGLGFVYDHRQQDHPDVLVAEEQDRPVDEPQVPEDRVEEAGLFEPGHAEAIAKLTIDGFGLGLRRQGSVDAATAAQQSASVRVSGGALHQNGSGPPIIDS